jgi:hypothetical protein
MLKYKSPTLVVSRNHLAPLIQELTSLVESGVSHPLISMFMEVCNKAVSTGCALTISGDMYPEMW